MWADPIADMLTRIRNGLRIGAKEVNVPGSKLKRGVAETLKREGYIRDFAWIDDEKQGTLRLYLKYSPEGDSVIRSIQRVSRPGRRIYRGTRDLPEVLNGLGIAVLSTPKGVLSNRECRTRSLGGEVLAEVW